MGIFAALPTILQVGGALIGAKASNDAADALEQQGVLTRAQAERQAEFAKELAETEARLTEEAARDEAEIAAYNAAIAREQAQWEEQSMEVDAQQSARQWQAHVGTFTAALGASGFRLDDTTSGVIAEQVSEMEQDILHIRQSGAMRVRRAEQQASLYDTASADALSAGARTAEAIRRAGDIDAETIIMTGQASAQASRIRASGARTGIVTSLLQGGVALTQDLARGSDSTIRGLLAEG